MARQQIASMFMVVVILLISSTALAQSGNLQLTLGAVSNGGGQSSSGQFTLVGTTGQLVTGFSSDKGRFTITDGFWPVLTNPTSQNGNLLLFPLIARSAPPTPIPPAVWQRMDTNGSLIVTTLAAARDQLFVGTRDGSQGLYRRSLATCQANVALTPVNLGGANTVQGIIFQGAEGIVAAYGNHLFYSNNSGQSWTQTGNNIDQPRAVAIAGNHTFYAGAEKGGIYRSVNGVDWGPLSGISQPINQLRLDSLDANSLWIATDKGGVAKLTVSTERLLQINEGLSGADQAEVWDFAFDSTHIYIATNDGVFLRGDRNTPWQRFGAGLSGKKVQSLDIVDDQLLYAGTSKAGVWRRPLNESRDWEQVTSAGWNPGSTVRDLLFYNNASCKGLLAATDNGVWRYPLP